MTPAASLQFENKVAYAGSSQRTPLKVMSMQVRRFLVSHGFDERTLHPARRRVYLTRPEFRALSLLLIGTADYAERNGLELDHSRLLGLMHRLRHNLPPADLLAYERGLNCHGKLEIMLDALSDPCRPFAEMLGGLSRVSAVSSSADNRRIRSIAARCIRSGKPPIEVVVDGDERRFMQAHSGAIWDSIAELRAGKSAEPVEPAPSPKPKAAPKSSPEPDDDDDDEEEPDGEDEKEADEDFDNDDVDDDPPALESKPKKTGKAGSDDCEDDD